MKERKGSSKVEHIQAWPERKLLEVVWLETDSRGENVLISCELMAQYHGHFSSKVGQM